MLIESIIRRKNGTKVTLGETLYHFLPDPEKEGRHVLEVTNPEHIQRFLSIPEGYRAYSPVQVKTPEPDMLVLEPAGEQPEPPSADEAFGGVTGAGVEGDGSIDRDFWVQKFEEKFGRKPHGKWSVDRIKAELEVN